MVKTICFSVLICSAFRDAFPQVMWLFELLKLLNHELNYLKYLNCFSSPFWCWVLTKEKVELTMSTCLNTQAQDGQLPALSDWCERSYCHVLTLGFFPLFTAYGLHSEVTWETSKSFHGGSNRGKDVEVQSRWAVKFDLHSEKQSRRGVSPISSPAENQCRAWGPSGTLSERTGRGKEQIKDTGEKIYGFSCQQSSNYCFHGGV